MAERALVFDASAWCSAAGDVGDNACFWKPATIVRRYVYPGRDEEVVDVRFDDRPDHVSRAHFVWGLREVS